MGATVSNYSLITNNPAGAITNAGTLNNFVGASVSFLEGINVNAVGVS